MVMEFSSDKREICKENGGKKIDVETEN